MVPRTPLCTRHFEHGAKLASHKAAACQPTALWAAARMRRRPDQLVFVRRQFPAKIAALTAAASIPKRWGIAAEARAISQDIGRHALPS